MYLYMYLYQFLLYGEQNGSVGFYYFVVYIVSHNSINFAFI